MVLSSRLMDTRSRDTNRPPKPSYFSRNSVLELAAVDAPAIPLDDGRKSCCKAPRNQCGFSSRSRRASDRALPDFDSHFYAGCMLVRPDDRGIDGMLLVSWRPKTRQGFDPTRRSCSSV